MESASFWLALAKNKLSPVKRRCESFGAFLATWIPWILLQQASLCIKPAPSSSQSRQQDLHNIKNLNGIWKSFPAPHRMQQCWLRLERSLLNRFRPSMQATELQELQPLELVPTTMYTLPCYHIWIHVQNWTPVFQVTYNQGNVFRIQTVKTSITTNLLTFTGKKKNMLIHPLCWEYLSLVVDKPSIN